MKESFVFYETWAEAIRQMPDKERLQMYDAIMAYGIYGAKTDLGGLAQMALNLVYNDIDECKAKRIERAEKNRENIKKRWNKTYSSENKTLQSNTNEYKRIQTNTKDNVDVNVNGNVNGNVNVNGNLECVENSTPHKTIEERKNDFMNEVAQIGKGVYPDNMLQSFFDYWSETNKNGRKMLFEMKKTFDTKKRLATWAKREQEYKFNKSNHGANRYNNPESDEYVPTERIVAAGIAMAKARI